MTGAALRSLAVAAFVAACQPLPHPFEDDRPPAALVKMRAVASVAVAPVEGAPTATAEKLSAAVAGALLKREIPASDMTTSLASYQLYGRVDEARPQRGNTVVTASWRLYDAKGETVGEKTARYEAPSGEWQSGDERAIAALAALSADQLLPLLEEEAPAVAAAGGGRIRVAIGRLSGAPGDGATALAAAAATVLRGQDLEIVEPGRGADLTIDGEVSVTPVKPDKQHIKILWRVRRADGSEIGTVGQENDVPKGLLDAAWGDLAHTVASAAGEGLMQLVARGATAPKS